MSHPVEHPTYMRDIRFLFEIPDINCMRVRGIDLRTHEGVKLNADRIYFHVREGTMPPPAMNRRWPQEQVETFYNWMRDGYPRGVAPQSTPSAIASTSVGRVRRDLAALDPNGDEIAKLRKAFHELMSREPDDPTSYFALAGIHWLPTPDVYCRHHENAYNPWHRAYLKQFEDALRAVPDCEDVTLPYWNIDSGKIPAILNTPPFDKYTLPRKLVSLDGQFEYDAGMETSRFSDNDILSNLNLYGVAQRIQTALGNSRWEDFNGWHDDDPWIDGVPRHSGIILAHDAGHVACGLTLANQDIAAFDPLFWFFHCNWDRLWWRWQQLYDAMTVDTFKTTLVDDGFWLTDPVANQLQPFGVRATDTIDLHASDVDYEHPTPEALPAVESPLVASARVRDGIAVADPDMLLVRVRGIDRLNIPGSFVVELTADSQPIASQPLFQSTSPKQCATCRKTAVLSLAFEVEPGEIARRRLGARIALIAANGTRQAFPLAQGGDPRIDVQVKLTEQR